MYLLMMVPIGIIGSIILILLILINLIPNIPILKYFMYNFFVFNYFFFIYDLFINFENYSSLSKSFLNVFFILIISLSLILSDYISKKINMNWMINIHKILSMIVTHFSLCNSKKSIEVIYFVTFIYYFIDIFFSQIYIETLSYAALWRKFKIKFFYRSITAQQLILLKKSVQLNPNLASNIQHKREE
jgi:hypothetical protein